MTEKDNCLPEDKKVFHDMNETFRKKRFIPNTVEKVGEVIESMNLDTKLTVEKLDNRFIRIRTIGLKPGDVGKVVRKFTNAHFFPSYEAIMLDLLEQV
jgi:hypothetical protein